jgi:hypothetical protein
MSLIFLLFLITQPEKETNPVNIVLNTGISLYQKCISPSQGDVCNFSPSCSHFAKSAIGKYGGFWGTLMALDRLMRCNPWSYQHFNTYYSGIKNYKIYDPVNENFIFLKKVKVNKDSIQKYNPTEQ